MSPPIRLVSADRRRRRFARQRPFRRSDPPARDARRASSWSASADLSSSTFQVWSGSTMAKSAGAPALRLPASRPSSRAGQAVIASMMRENGTLAERVRPKAAENRVSRPMAPNAASEKGRRLVSAFCGSWPETMTSMVPSATAGDQSVAIVLAAQRRRQLEEGAVGADVVLVEHQMIDRDAARYRKAAGLGGAHDLERGGGGHRGGVIARPRSARPDACRAPA